MKISYNWLKELIDINLPVEELVEKITFAGIEVEAVYNFKEILKDIIVAKITKVEKHPDSDKLKVCQVFDGKEELNIVCGAVNCKENMLTALAPVGAKINEISVKKAKLRGIESFGFLCSEKELGISSDHSGIIELPNDLPVGKSFSQIAYFSDVIIDVEITPNRPDLLGMLGIANDIAAICCLPFKKADINTQIKTYGNISEDLKIINQNAEICPRYTARLIKDIKVAPSPYWLKNRLNLMGVSSVNNIVDATNYVLLEYGIPIHAFDYACIDGKAIEIRLAKKGEKLLALNSKEYELDENDIVIADTKNVLGLAGIIGGKTSGINETTKDIVIEVANFEYSYIHKSSNKYKIFTDASYRFERDLPSEKVRLVSDRIVEFILKISDGKLADGIIDSYIRKQEEIFVELRPSKVKKILTIDIDNALIISYMESLGLKLIKESEDKLKFQIPCFRKDLYREIDLIEEIIRLWGYNNVKTYLKNQDITDKETLFTKRKISDYLVFNGFYEVVNSSFMDEEILNKFFLNEEDEQKKSLVKLLNPMGASFSSLRTFLLPNLLKNMALNLNQKFENIRLFELNKVFFQKSDGFANEPILLSGVLCGNISQVYWKQKSQAIDFYFLKGLMEDVLSQLDLKNYQLKSSSEKYFEKTNSMSICLNDEIIGNFGKINYKVLDYFDIKNQTIFAFEINLTKVINLKSQEKIVFKEFSKYPSVKRDLSFIIDKNYSVENIIKVFYSSNSLIKSVELFDQYIDEKKFQDKKSLSFSIIISSYQDTLKDFEIDNIMNKLINDLTAKFSIELR